MTSLIRKTLEAYGIDPHQTPETPQIIIPDPGEPDGIIVEQFVRDHEGNPLVSKQELVTTLVFFPDPTPLESNEKPAKDLGEPLTLEQVQAKPLRKFTSNGKELNYIGVKMGLNIAKAFAKDATDEDLFQSVYGPCYWADNQ